MKKPHRSVSASPSRAKSTDNELSKPALRRSPRKQSQKTINGATEEQSPAMTGIIIGDTAYIATNPDSTIDNPGSEVIKPIKKATSSKSSKLRPQSKTFFNFRTSIGLTYHSRRDEGSSETNEKTHACSLSC